MDCNRILGSDSDTTSTENKLPGRAVDRIAEPSLDVHPPSHTLIGMRAVQQHGVPSRHPIVDVVWPAQKVKTHFILARGPALAGLTLEQDQPVGQLAGVYLSLVLGEPPSCSPVGGSARCRCHRCERWRRPSSLARSCKLG
jgi:hypothetical protein